VAHTALLARVEPEIQRLQEAADSAGRELTGVLDTVTKDMIARFTELRSTVERALAGEPLEVGESSNPADILLPQTQQFLVPPSNLPVFQEQMPPMQQIAPVGPAIQGPDLAPIAPTSELRAILEALVNHEPDADQRLTDYARRDIVESAYAHAQDDWNTRIRPAYLDALAATEARAREAATGAPESAAATAAALLAAADEMATQRTAIAAIEIRHDANVDAALGTDWWRTVQGKGAFADAVAQSIDDQMRTIATTAAAPSAAIRQTLALQKTLRDQLEERQKELGRQFDAQQKQLATLSGASGVVPVDLASFIGLFPLVIGLVLGLMQLRIGQARRQAALAAADLAGAAPDDPDTRRWLIRRVLGGGNVRVPLLVTMIVAVGVWAWVALAARLVELSLTDPPLAPWIGAAIAAILVLVAVVWDAAAIRKLAAELKR
jgi:hypothetical protein